MFVCAEIVYFTNGEVELFALLNIAIPVAILTVPLPLFVISKPDIAPAELPANCNGSVFSIVRWCLLQLKMLGQL
jgi:hypothetical protein